MEREEGVFGGEGEDEEGEEGMLAAARDLLPGETGVEGAAGGLEGGSDDDGGKAEDSGGKTARGEGERRLGGPFLPGLCGASW